MTGAYGEGVYADGPYGGIAGYLSQADPDELQRIARVAAQVVAHENRNQMIEFLAGIDASPQQLWRRRVDDLNAISELMRNVVIVVVLLAGGVSYTVDQVEALLEQRSDDLEQLPPSKHEESQLEDSPAEHDQ